MASGMCRTQIWYFGNEDGYEKSNQDVGGDDSSGDGGVNDSVSHGTGGR